MFNLKKWLLISVFVVMVISFGGTFYIQHQAFSEQKSTMKSNFDKEQKKTNQQLKDLQTKNSELEKTVKTTEEKLKKLEDEVGSLNENAESTNTPEVSSKHPQDNTPADTQGEVPVQETSGKDENVSATNSKNTSASQNPTTHSNSNRGNNIDPTETKNLEIENYFNTKKNEIIEKKKAQVQAWKNSGEVNWSDDLISNSLNEFSNSFPPLFSYQSSESLDIIKSRIDKDFQNKFDYQFIK